MSWCRGKEQRRTERFPHHAHYIRHCPSSSKSMIILFALVLWKPFRLSYQHHLIIIDTGCDVTQTALTWIIHCVLSVLGIETFAPTLRLNIHAFCPTQIWMRFYWSRCLAWTPGGHAKSAPDGYSVFLMRKQNEGAAFFYIVDTLKSICFMRCCVTKRKGLINKIPRISTTGKEPYSERCFMFTTLAAPCMAFNCVDTWPQQRKSAEH